MGGRRRWLDYAVVMTATVVLAFLFWPSGAGEMEPAPVGESVAATPTEEPAETPGPESSEAAEVTLVSECVPGDASQVLSDFVQSFRHGDFEQVAAILPPDGTESATASVYPGMNPHVLYAFDMPGYRDGNRRSEILDYLFQRFDDGEVWRIKEYSLTGSYRDIEAENPKIDVAHAVIQRSAPDVATHSIEGRAVINCVDGLLIGWEFASDHPDLVEPIAVSDFLDALGPYGIGEQRSLRMIVRTDFRADGSPLNEWDLRREEGTSYEGRLVESVNVFDMDGHRVISYVWDGEAWYLYQRGWQAGGDLSLRPALPFEILVARRDPAITGTLIAERQDQIPDVGRYVISEELDEIPEVLLGTASHLEAPITNASMEIEIVDGAVVRTRYRLSDQTGSHVLTPEIRWVVMERKVGLDRSLFHRPRTGVTSEFQFRIPTELSGMMVPVNSERQPEDLGELYEIRLDELTMPVLMKVIPSSGGLLSDAQVSDWDPTWVRNLAEYSGGTLIWVDHASAGYPTLATWDDGRFRFELRATAQLPPYVQWDLDELISLVETLSN